MFNKILYTVLFLPLIYANIFAQNGINIRPEVTLGKQVNGNRALEVIPFRMSWRMSPEWRFGFGYSVSYTKSRSGAGVWNHYGQRIPVKVEFKPYKFMSKKVNKFWFEDLTLTFEKNFGQKYSGATNDVDYLITQPYEKVGIGFNLEL